MLLRPGNWKESEAQAVAMGGHLATIRNQAEEDWIFNTFGGYGGFQRLLWTGLSYDKKLHFSWSSGESLSYTAWANNEPKNPGQSNDFVAIYYPNHKQHNHWKNWGERRQDPINLPMCGVVEILPSRTAKDLVVDAGQTNHSAVSGAVQIKPGTIVTNDGASIKMEWPVEHAGQVLEKTTNLRQRFTCFGYTEGINAEAGMIYVTVSNAAPQTFFRLREP